MDTRGTEVKSCSRLESDVSRFHRQTPTGLGSSMVGCLRLERRKIRAVQRGEEIEAIGLIASGRFLAGNGVRFVGQRTVW